MYSSWVSNDEYQTSLHKAWITLTDIAGEKDGGRKASVPLMSPSQMVVTAKVRSGATTGIHTKEFRTASR